MVVGCGDETNFVTMLQVHSAEPFKVAVHRHDLDQTFHINIALAPISRLVRVGDNQHIFRIILFVELII